MLAELTGAGRAAESGMAGAAPGGGRGADIVGGLGTELRDDSGSDAYVESGFAVTLLNHFLGMIMLKTDLLYRLLRRAS